MEIEKIDPFGTHLQFQNNYTFITNIGIQTAR